ncbi:insulinase family protein [Thiotrichales bacterium 19S3-7]|nr:insulinase family protein [Thiotrichales bacterium 19S3-7]MCF6801266.1 insulinase family protein [Thiotrichales bacterium 19S3-11]
MTINAIASENKLEKPLNNSDKPEIISWQTENGAKVLFIQSNEVPIVDIQVSFQAGSAYDANLFGLASLTASLLETGVKGMDEDELINQLTLQGAHYSEHSSRDAATFTLRSMSMPEYLTPSVTIFQRILTTPTFPELQFERAKKQQLTSIAMDEQYPDDVAYKALMHALYPDHPYGHAIDGTSESVMSISLKDAKDFYNRYYLASNASIAIIGDISEKTAREISNQIIKNMPKGERAQPIKEPKPLSKSQTIHIPFPSNQTTIVKGTLSIKKGSDEFFALMVANQILGGDGMSSLLFQRVRKDKGLAYGVHSMLRTMQVKGVFLVEAKTRNDKAYESIDTINEVLSNFNKNGPTEENLTLAKKYLIGSFPLSMATNRSKLNLLSIIGFYNLPLNYLDTYMHKVEVIDRSQVKDTFDRIINLNHMVTVTVGNATEAKT